MHQHRRLILAVQVIEFGPALKTKNQQPFKFRSCVDRPGFLFHTNISLRCRSRRFNEMARLDSNGRSGLIHPDVNLGGDGGLESIVNLCKISGRIYAHISNAVRMMLISSSLSSPTCRLSANTKCMQQNNEHRCEVPHCNWNFVVSTKQLPGSSEESFAADLARPIS